MSGRKRRNNRAVTIRLPLDLYDRAEEIACVEGVTMTRLVEQAVESWIESKSQADGMVDVLKAIREFRQCAPTPTEGATE